LFSITSRTECSCSENRRFRIKTPISLFYLFVV
jgi:hypothetical protein